MAIMQPSRNRRNGPAEERTWISRNGSAGRKPSPTSRPPRPMPRCPPRWTGRAERPPAGTPLPPLWHWLYFLPLHRQSEIGPDGHAKRGGFLPPVPLPRRMWAGSQFEFHAPLARRRHAHARVDDRGRDREERPHRPAGLRQGAPRDPSRATSADVALTEFHDIVYREAAKPGRRRAAAESRAVGRGVGAQVGSRRRAAVSLLGADVQRPPDPLRPPLRDRGRGLSRADRPRPADRDAAARSAAPPAAGRRAWRATSSGPCGPSSTSIPSSSAASRSRTAGRSGSGRAITKAS